MNLIGRKKNKRLGLAAGVVMGLFSKQPPKTMPKKLEFRTSTQRVGCRFSERIRGFFRFRWFSVKS